MANFSPLNALFSLFVVLATAMTWLYVARRVKEDRLDKTLDELKEIANTADKHNALLKAEVASLTEQLARMNQRLGRFDSENRRLIRRNLLLDDHRRRCERLMRERGVEIPEAETPEEVEE